MKKSIYLIFIALLIAFSLASCSSTSEGLPIDNEGFITSQDEIFTERDERTEYDGEEICYIAFNGETCEIDGDGASFSDGTLKIEQDGIYSLKGSLTGSIVIDAPSTAKPSLLLNGLVIQSNGSCPLLVKECDKLFITLCESSSNSISAIGEIKSAEDDGADGALFSRSDLTVNGSGSLSINADCGHGIVCKDDLAITGGAIDITASLHAIDANDSVRINGASLYLESGKDGIHAENAFDESLGFVYIGSGRLNINALGDGIDASSTIQIEAGEINITTSSGEITDSYKGIKAQKSILVRDGGLNIESADDSIHSNLNLYIYGGKLSLSSADDGIHADESLEITGGEINITRSYEGIEALDILIKGGAITLVASDDGINAAGGADSSGFGGMGGDQFGMHGMGRPGMGGPGMGGPGMGGGMTAGDGSIEISGGQIDITASGDGIDANGTLLISGGTVYVAGPTQGDTATLDYDVSGIITGGTFIGTGAMGMAQTFSDSKQGVLALTVGNASAGDCITLSDSNGRILLKHTPPLDYNVVILSCPEMKKGETYTITVGEASGSFEAS